MSHLADTRAAVEAAGSGLAPSHALALRLEAEGASEVEMARALGVPYEAVAPLLEVARAKLARIARVGLAWLAAFGVASSDAAAQIVVDTIADGSGGPACTLRDAIVAANKGEPWAGCDGGPEIDYGRIDLTGLRGTIELYETLPAIGQESFAYGIHVIGPGADLLAISAANANGGAFVNVDAYTQETSIEGVTIRDGADTCVRNEGVLTLRDCRITSCHGATGGAAVDSGDMGPMTVLDRCLVDGNTGGPAIRVGGVAGSGGLRMQNSTVSGNEAGVRLDAEGPGGPHLIYSSTLAHNGGVNLDVGADDLVTLRHVLFAHAPGSANCARGGMVYRPPGTLQIESLFSLVSDMSCLLDTATNGQWVDPMIGPLADNGGPTYTHALLPGSPAIDTGSLFACEGAVSYLVYDQRGPGHPRTETTTPGAQPRCDVGAFEVPEPRSAALGAWSLAALAALARARRSSGRKTLGHRRMARDPLRAQRRTRWRVRSRSLRRERLFRVASAERPRVRRDRAGWRRPRARPRARRRRDGVRVRDAGR
jgi:hypothetical protein